MLRLKARGDGPRRKPLKEIIHNFTPAWFAVTMGTGAISMLFNAFPYGRDSVGMHIMALIFFFLNLSIFIAFTVISIVRYAMFPTIWSITMADWTQKLNTGIFPMGATTLMNICVSLINGRYGFGGRAFLYTIWAFWWVDVAISVACCWGVVHIMQTSHQYFLEDMTSAWLLPVVPLIVASSSGGILASALHKHTPSGALFTQSFSVFILAIGISFSFMLLTMYAHRLIVYGLPEGTTIISVFLPLGPTAQAGNSVLLIGDYYKQHLPLATGTSDFLRAEASATIIWVTCVCLAFILWSISAMWFIFALMGIQRGARRDPLPFKVGFWGLIFPNGVYANLTIGIGNAFDSPMFKIMGSIYAVAILCAWIFVALRTVRMVYTTEIFEPLENLEEYNRHILEKRARNSQNSQPPTDEVDSHKTV